MPEPRSYGELMKRMNELSRDTSPEAQAECDDLVERLITLDMSMQGSRRDMCRSRSENESEAD